MHTTISMKYQDTALFQTLSLLLNTMREIGLYHENKESTHKDENSRKRDGFCSKLTFSKVYCILWLILIFCFNVLSIAKFSSSYTYGVLLFIKIVISLFGILDICNILSCYWAHDVFPKFFLMWQEVQKYKTYPMEATKYKKYVALVVILSIVKNGFFITWFIYVLLTENVIKEGVVYQVHSETWQNNTDGFYSYRGLLGFDNRATFRFV